MKSHRENSNHPLCLVPEIKILKNRTSHTCQTPVRPPGARQRHSHIHPSLDTTFCSLNSITFQEESEN